MFVVRYRSFSITEIFPHSIKNSILSSQIVAKAITFCKEIVFFKERKRGSNDESGLDPVERRRRYFEERSDYTPETKLELQVSIGV